jgi:hypothetical protein
VSDTSNVVPEGALAGPEDGGALLAAATATAAE